jgi:hypothetical protein
LRRDRNIFDLITFDVGEEKIDGCGPSTGEIYEYTILKQAKPGAGAVATAACQK